MDDRNLRTEFHQALDAVAPPAPWLGARIREDLRKQRHESWMDRVRRKPAQTRWAMAGLTMALVAIVVGVAFLVAQLNTSVPVPVPGGQPSPSPTPSAIPTLTAAEQTQLAQLESRALKIPPMPANGKCPDGPHSNISPYQGSSAQTYVWGKGPVYAEGGPEVRSSQINYFDVTYYTDPTVKGVVLIRGEQLDGRLKLVFIGIYAAGPVVGTDNVGGPQAAVHAEAALPAANVPAGAGAAPGWGVWKLRQGIDKSYRGCTGIQIDTAAGSEVVVALG